MDVFAFRDSVIEDYERFSRSFTRLQADDIQSYVDAAYAEGRFWPAPLIQLNPSFVPGRTIEQLVAQGVLEAECQFIFRAGKGEGCPGHSPPASRTGRLTTTSSVGDSGRDQHIAVKHYLHAEGEAVFRLASRCFLISSRAICMASSSVIGSAPGSGSASAAASSAASR